MNDSTAACSVIEFCVEDTGIGISQEKQAIIFEQFSKLDEHATMNEMGCGLGLSISNKLALRLGPANAKQGIQVKSTLRKGSFFSFQISGKIPASSQSIQSISVGSNESLENYQAELNEKAMQINLPRVAPMYRASARVHSIPKPSCDCVKVLIVDDNEYNTYGLTLMLKIFNIASHSANNGKAAIDKITSHAQEMRECDCKGYSLIFMDCEMPVMNGFQATKKIRELSHSGVLPRDLHIVAQTGHTHDEEIKKCIDCGMNDCLSKPVFKDSLEKILRKYERELLAN